MQESSERACRLFWRQFEYTTLCFKSWEGLLTAANRLEACLRAGRQWESLQTVLAAIWLHDALRSIVGGWSLFSSAVAPNAPKKTKQKSKGEKSRRENHSKWINQMSKSSALSVQSARRWSSSVTRINASFNALFATEISRRWTREPVLTFSRAK